ncbi:unnamed protein product [Schistosoma rodhaini]|nr:unnamed protein product [Schistosoma rodhaini]
MTEHKNPTDINEVLPPSLAAVREIFSEFNVSEVSDEICTRVLDVLYSMFCLKVCHYTVGHTCDVIEEAKAVSHHAGRTKIEEDDVQLAINSVTDGLMFAPPYRDQLLAYAEKNEQPLPAVRPHCGIRLPAERFTLTAPNYSLLPCADNAKTNPSSELAGDSSMALHISNPVNSTKNIFRAINPSVRPITVGNPMGPSVHVIAAPGMGPSMIRVQTVQNVTQLSNVDTSTGLRTLPVGPTVSSVMSLNRRFMDTS